MASNSMDSQVVMTTLMGVLESVLGTMSGVVPTDKPQSKESDIIEYDGTGWFVSFNAKTTTDTKYVTNLTTGVQLKWNPTDAIWMKAVENIYQNGSWTIVLTTG